jgi:CTP synthase
VNPKYIKEFENAGMKFVGRSTDDERMEILELDNHPYFVAVQYHPEYISRPLKPSAPYLGLIWVCGLQLYSYSMSTFDLHFRLPVVS